jgi:nucleoside-diphosphate-sugar epimerase
VNSILLLGVNSYLGASYLRYLQKQPDCKVVGVYRRSCSNLDPESARDAQLVKCDLFDAHLLSLIIEETAPNVIINFAAKIDITGVPEDYNESLATSISQAIALAGVECKIINIGSAAEYAPNSTGTFLETCESGGLSPYGRSKWRQWQVFERELSAANCGLLGLRVFNVIAPGANERFLISTIAKQVKSGKSIVKLGELGSVRDFVDVRDVMSAIFLAQRSDVTGTFFNVCSGCSYSVMQVVDAFSVVSGRELLVESSAERKRAEDVSVAVGCRALINKKLGWTPKFNLLESIAMIMESEL